MKFSGTFPIVCLVSFGVFVLSLAGISVLLHTEPPVSGSILTVPLAFVIALAIAAPAFLVFAITGIAMLLHPIQKSNEKEAMSAKTPNAPDKNKEEANSSLIE